MTDLEQELEAKSFLGVIRCREHNVYQSVWDTFHRPLRGQPVRICTHCHIPVCRRTCVRFVRRKPYCQVCAEQEAMKSVYIGKTLPEEAKP